MIPSFILLLALNGCTATTAIYTATVDERDMSTICNDTKIKSCNDFINKAIAHAKSVEGVRSVKSFLKSKK